jgi:O-antigen/teichoic acid export membrane protein
MIAVVRGGLWAHRQSLASLAMRGAGVLAGFVVTFLIGRWFGPRANGQYAIVTQTAMFLSIVAVGGLDLAVVREFSRTQTVGKKLALSTFLRSLGQVVLLALIIVAALTIGGDRLLRLMGPEAVPANALVVLCMILLARTMTRFLASMLRSQSRFVLAQAVEVLLIPLGTIALVAVGAAHSVRGLLWATAAAGLATAAIGVAASLRLVGRGQATLSVPNATLYATALPLWGVAVTQNLSDWYGLATVSAVAGIYDAGLYRVAAQFAMAFSLVSTGLFGTFATQISSAFHAEDRQRVATLASSATRLSAVLMAPVAASFLLFAPRVMGLVGPEFRAGAPLLQVLVIGQVAIALASPAGLVLALTGHPRVNLAFTGISAAFILLLAPMVGHAFGAVGIAAFVSAALVGQNIAAHLSVRRLEGIDALFGRVLVRRDQL